MARLHLVLLVAEQQQAFALEHDEELFLDRVAVGRAGKLARGDGDMPETGGTRAHGVTEIAPNASN